MRYCLAALVIAAGFMAAPAKAQDYPWCAEYANDNSRNCGFMTLAQRRATISGIGGWCVRNPLYGRYRYR